MNRHDDAQLSNLPTSCSALSILQTTFCCAPLCLATLQLTIRSALLYGVSLQLAMRSALPILLVDSKTDYTLSSTCRYYNRLSALLYLSILCGALLCLVMIQVTIYSTLSIGMLGGGLV
jgi:hypothetical protein